MSDKKCPRCGGESTKAFYAGVSGRLCKSDECMTLFGRFISVIPSIYPEWETDNSFDVTRYNGSYFKMLLCFLRDESPRTFPMLKHQVRPHNKHIDYCERNKKLFLEDD